MPFAVPPWAWIYKWSRCIKVLFLADCVDEEVRKVRLSVNGNSCLEIHSNWFQITLDIQAENSLSGFCQVHLCLKSVHKKKSETKACFISWMKYQSYTSFNSDSTLIRLISLIKHQHVPRTGQSSSKRFFRLIPRWGPAEYFILKTEIGCPVLFTRAAFCLRCEEMDRQNKTPGQSIEATDWNVRCFVFQPASHVQLSWRCAGVHEGQLRDSLSWKLRSFSVHLSFRPGSDCFFFLLLHICYKQ